MKTNTNRRDFLRIVSTFTASMALHFPVWAKSAFSSDYPLHNIPESKNLAATWLDSLYKRGEPTIYRKSKNELRYIGMPVGGLHAGTVYVGGDGRLWLWQIYNETMEYTHEGIDPKLSNWNDGLTYRKIRPRDGAAYVEPAIADNKRVLDQGFAIKVVINDKSFIKELNEDNWDEVTFSGSYPVAEINFTSKDFPLEVKLKVYSPFIPHDADNSSLPLTILRVEVLNRQREKLNVQVLGWMENGVSKLSSKSGSGIRKNVIMRDSDSTSINFTLDTPHEEVRNAIDFGSMCYCLHHPNAISKVVLSPWPVKDEHFTADGKLSAFRDPSKKLVGGAFVEQTVEGGKSMFADFSISWHFNNVNPKLKTLVADAALGYYYANKYKDAFAVTSYFKKEFSMLTEITELWNKTWKDSTLPHWFLERTFLNIGTLATANTYRFANGRFWSWEGVGACPGTCTHVWQYAHAVARIFPELERDQRQRVDLGVGYNSVDGSIHFRAENQRRPAIDGQAGTILRFYREHQMCTNYDFLKKNWQRVKMAITFMLAQDKNDDGMIDTPMENTLDAIWEGEISWIVGLCLAAAKAGQKMAEEVDDIEFAKICKQFVDRGQQNMQKDLFNGEYFIHRPSSKTGRQKLGSYNTCHIDQVYGQSWAFQVGLPRILNKEMTLQALTALWKYNFTPDLGPYIKTHTGGRPYALAGEGGMVMNTNPYNESSPYGENLTWQLGYFHECMSGFEHQVAAHMIAEGKIMEGLAITRTIHERYSPNKRNPYNEIECSDHYARAMSSYGTFITSCGFEYHGPKGYIRFAPQWNKMDFKAPFTTSKGWGTYQQGVMGSQQIHRIELKYGLLSLSKISLDWLNGKKCKSVKVNLEQKPVSAKLSQLDDKVILEFSSSINISKNQTLIITLNA